ncbi:MAG: hypothetical protein ACD_28C00016G0004 [uncultured bacterium]|nr:MAG: hypothetical protein ACD_28C00016G0004 [uncultured bacterium]KKT74852.1 MAG: hypothetical protein UW70_C0044G0022 [Candidatus Peregrinibacteria bacterium GW2011_GWA2_44_7]
MIPRVITVKYLDYYKLRLTFEDNKKVEIDLKPYLWGEAFEPLKKIEYFKKVRIDETTGTIMWPNGTDLSPEFLYKQSQ